MHVPSGLESPADSDHVIVLGALTIGVWAWHAREWESTVSQRQCGWVSERQVQRASWITVGAFSLLVVGCTVNVTASGSTNSGGTGGAAGAAEGGANNLGGTSGSTNVLSGGSSANSGTGSQGGSAVADGSARSGIRILSAGLNRTCVVFTDGTIQCWGENGYGTLGNGSTTSSATPVTVSGITNAMAVSAGNYYHACAVLQSGTVQCWGRNDKGQLGDGSATNSATPVTVSGITSAIAVGAGEGHTCALLTGGTVMCWGWNFYDQLGSSNASTTTSPIKVAGITNAIVLSVGFDYACTLQPGGTVQCWGYNSRGQLGSTVFPY